MRRLVTQVCGVALFAIVVVAGTLAGVSLSSSTQTTEVRIQARHLEDGRTEFALQQRQENGLWGERVLPKARKLPARTDGNWKSSSPIEVTVQVTAVAEDLAGEAVSTGESENPWASFFRVHSNEFNSSNDDSIRFAFSAEEEHGAGWQASLTAVGFGKNADSTYDDLIVLWACTEAAGGFFMAIKATSAIAGSTYDPYVYGDVWAEYRTSGRGRWESLSVTETAGTFFVYGRDAKDAFEEARQSEWIQVRFGWSDSSHGGRLDLRGLFDSRVVSMLNLCAPAN